MNYFYEEEGINSLVFLPLGNIAYRIGYFNYGINNPDGSTNILSYENLTSKTPYVYSTHKLNLKPINQGKIDKYNIMITPKHNRPIIKLIFKHNNGDK